MSPLGVRMGVFMAAVLVTGCATHRPQTLSDLLIRTDKSPSASHQNKQASKPDPALQAALDKEMAKVRELAAQPRPPRTDVAPTIEQNDSDLASAREALAEAPTAANHRRVAEQYARLHVLDAAYDHYTAAIQLEPKDASSYDGRARVRRDWGVPQLGLSDVYHAIYFAPASPVPRNTLGTLLLKMGLVEEARTSFKRALDLDPEASYARENLCRLAPDPAAPPTICRTDR